MSGTGAVVLVFLLACVVLTLAAALFVMLLLRFADDRRDVQDTRRQQEAQLRGEPASRFAAPRVSAPPPAERVVEGGSHPPQ